MLTVTGTGFQSGAVVRLNGTALTTAFLSATELRATGSTTKKGGFPVTVTNPDGQISAGYTVTFEGSRRLR
jgi:IPT/TIG domain-containing protein